MLELIERRCTPHIMALAIDLTGDREDSTETCVLDVRDEDFQGGHIRGCLNIWSEEFYDDENVDAVIQKHGLLRYRQVVVTCFMSQQRGPFCAKRYRLIRLLRSALHRTFVNRPSVIVTVVGTTTLGFQRM